MNVRSGTITRPLLLCICRFYSSIWTFKAGIPEHYPKKFKLAYSMLGALIECGIEGTAGEFDELMEVLDRKIMRPLQKSLLNRDFGWQEEAEYFIKKLLKIFDSLNNKRAK